MIVSKTDEKVYYPKRKIDYLVLSLEYKYSECHSNNEMYFYQSKQAFTKSLDCDLYFEARNRKTNQIEACILGYKTKYEGYFKYNQITSLMVDKLSFNTVEALMKLLHYIESMYKVFTNFPTLVLTDLDITLKKHLDNLVSFYEIHDRYKERNYYVNDEAFNLKVYGIAFNYDDGYTYEDERAIYLDKDFEVFNKYGADDTFEVQAENDCWPVPTYKYMEEEDNNLVYFNDEPPIGLVRFNKLYYKNKVVGYFVYDTGIDEIENKRVPVAYIYDMYIDPQDDFKFKVLKYILNYIKFNTFKWLTSYFVTYKLNDGKDVFCNCLIVKFSCLIVLLALDNSFFKLLISL